MNRYWPNEQSLELNLAVANLFVQTYDKLSIEISNYTEKQIPIDIIDKYKRKELFIYILIEIEILILDIIEIDVTLEEIKKISHKLLYDLINKIVKKFFTRIKYYEQNKHINYHNNYIKLLFSEQKCLIEKLLVYLTFGSNCINHNIFPFYYMETPKEHVIILLENFIIQTSNLIIFNLIDNIKSLPETSRFLIINNLCDIKEISIRSVSIFRNNLINDNWLNYYFNYPKNIYSSKYSVWLLSSKGLINKYIYMDRSLNYLELSHMQLFCILFLELQDLIVPKIQNCIIIIGKLIIYVLINILSKSLKICFKSIIGFIKNIEN
uniref:Uncharacterized protein n=1 Tax=Sporolithon durum TaxID=48970 RepID=A0A141SD15_9FLOR|nr:hypothetical protein Sdur_137 [Sporolithon durum]AMK96183.1 hypothetical protein Sdur_137 [Sporolithon durum]